MDNDNRNWQQIIITAVIIILVGIISLGAIGIKKELEALATISMQYGEISTEAGRHR